MTINFNVSPYYDDYDEVSKYLRILFRPGYPVQARELTQLQSILQNQVNRFGDHVFRQGAMVLPGQISYDDEFNYVKLQETYNGVSVDTYIEEMVGYTVVGNTTGVKAKVVAVAPSTTDEPPTLYIKYVTAGDDTVTKVFQDNEIITSEDKPTARAFTAALSDSTGTGSAAQIERGVYYVNGFFMLVEPQTLLLDKYTNTPTYRVGLKLTESIVTPEEEPALQDNAQGSSNFAAPGAHRYKATLTLEKRTIETTEDKDFIELLRVKTGQIQYKVRTTDYSVLEATLARRTYDESGNYTVRNFPIDVREHRNNNRGEWVENTSYITGDIVFYSILGATRYYVATSDGISGSQPPIHTTGTATDGVGGITWKYASNVIYNRGVFDPITEGGVESKLAIGLEPGKAYVQGYELEKIGTEYVEVDKARDFTRVSDAQVDTTVGNYILVNNLHALPRFDQYQQVDLYDQLTATGGTAAGSKVGTARVRGIELHALGASRAADVYKLLLADVLVNDGVDFNRKVKQVYYNTGTTATNFTSDIAHVSTALVGSITSYTSNTYGTAGAGAYILGNGTKFSTDLVVGDYIEMIDTSGTVRTVRVTTVTSDTRIVIDASGYTFSAVALNRVSTALYEPENSSLIFPLPFYAVRKIRSNDDITIGTSYTVTQRFVQTSSSSSGGTCTLTINAVGSADTFGSSAINSNYLLIKNTTGEVVIPSNIEVVSPSYRQVVFTLSSSHASTAFTVVAAVKKSSIDAKEKTKTLTSYTTSAITTAVAATKSKISLGKADGYRLVSVMMDTGTFAMPTGVYTIDIMDRYYFADGQKDSYYDVASIELKPGMPAPSAPIKITFEYFEHGSGDYFSVDSYAGSGVRYEDIPSYAGVSLRDFMDFRPRIDDTGVDFSSAGSSNTQLPKRGFNVEADISYYLARKDKIAIDFNGKFFQVKGVPSVNPAEPEDPKNGMVLYKLSYEPYTFGTDSNSVQIQSIDNRRYTMRDIGALEKRIDNLEYYTSLSLLEQETSSLSIPDDQGLDRFKNGFIVDSFTGHGVGDVMSTDYNCSVDMENKELRPFFRMDNVNLIEKNSTTAQRTASGYQITGDVATLPYTNIELIKQGVASRVENINPFAIFTFVGRINLNPASDEWFEVDRRPDIVNNVEGNFNAIKTALEKSGALGTVWNSWQNQWAGVPRKTQTVFEGQYSAAWVPGRNAAGVIQLSPAEMNARFGFKQGNGWAFRRITTETTAIDITQSRTGVRTVVVPKIDRQLVEDRVLSTAVIPYIRSRAVLVQAKAFKPRTRLYTFFDGINVSDHIQPATKISITAVSGFGSEFNSTDNVGSNSTETARRINGDQTSNTLPALNKGDVITGLTSGATAVCVGMETLSTGAKSIYVLNINGTFQLNEVVVGSISGARGTINTAVTVNAKGSNLTSTTLGDVYALFTIPNTDALRFRTGIKELKITDSSSNSGDFTSQGSVQYRAQGILETKQATINAVRNATVASEVVNETRTITETSERVVGDTGWYDPLAQTFLVQQKGGCFLTGVDIFFATKDDSIPVTLEIREVVNGYPGKKVLPFSVVSKPANDVRLSTNSVSVDGTTYKSPDTPTRFTFESPVFVNDATEYAIILASDSNNYRCWISQLGDKVAGTDRFISEQPYAGVFFKSQNASTWTADQTQDLMFTIYRAQFNTNVDAQLDFVNDILPNNVLQNDPLQTTSGSNIVRVWHPDHDMFPGSKVRIQNIASGTYNGIPSTELNGTHTISDIDLDSYTITTTTNATSTGFTGGEEVEATDNFQFDVLQPMIQNQTFTETTLEFEAKTTSGRSVDGSEVPYVKDSSGVFVAVNDSNMFTTPKVVASEVNETNFMSGDKSITVSALMSTTVDNLSPVIDMNRASIAAIHNKVNNATAANTNISPVDLRTVLSGSTNVAITATGLSTSDSSTKLAFQTLAIGRYLTVSGATTTTNNGTFLVTDIATDGSTITLSGSFTPAVAGTAITLVSNEKFYDEIAPVNGSQFSKYLTRRINLANPSTYLRIRFAINLPTNANVDVYYKLNKVGSNRDFATVPYTLVEPDAVIPRSTNYNSFVDVEYSEKDLTQFDAIQVKIVFRSTNSSEVPRIRDLRVIACA